MASEAAESSRAREQAPEREADEEAARQQRTWVALSNIPVVYGADHERGQELAPGTADLLLEVEKPPRPSYLALPERIAPDPGYHPYIIASATSSCDVRAGTATRLPAVPSHFPIKLSPRRTTGLVADPSLPGNLMLGQLHPTPRAGMRRHAALLSYSSATKQWAVKPLASAPGHEPWGAHGVVGHDGLLWWIDVAYAMLVCDPFDDQPHLRLVPLPDGSEMQGLGDRPRPTTLMDQRRCIRVSRGMLRYVEIQGLPYDDSAAFNRTRDKPAVAIWTLVDDPTRPDSVGAGIKSGSLDASKKKVVYINGPNPLFHLRAAAEMQLNVEPARTTLRGLKSWFEFSLKNIQRKIEEEANSRARKKLIREKKHIEGTLKVLNIDDE